MGLKTITKIPSARFGLMSALFLLLFQFSLPSFAQQQCAACPPAYCLNPTVAQGLKARKKAAAEALGLPKRLSALYDKLPNCEACIKNAPSLPYVIWVFDKPTSKGQKSSRLAWTRTVEHQARADMRDGKIQQFYIVLDASPCHCCTARNDEEYEEWVSIGGSGAREDDTNWNNEYNFPIDQIISITDEAQLGTDPADLTEIPPGFRPATPVPGRVEDFIGESPTRIVQVQCAECQTKADEYNAKGEEINRQNQQLAALKRDHAYEVAMMDYLYRMDNALRGLASTEKTLGQIADIAREVQQRATAREGLETSVAEAEARLATLHTELIKLLAQIQDCEASDACIVAVEEPAEETIYYVVGGSMLPFEPVDVEDEFAFMGTSGTEADNTESIEGETDNNGTTYYVVGGSIIPGGVNPVETSADDQVTTLGPAQAVVEFRSILSDVKTGLDNYKNETVPAEADEKRLEYLSAPCPKCETATTNYNTIVDNLNAQNEKIKQFKSEMAEMTAEIEAKIEAIEEEAKPLHDEYDALTATGAILDSQLSEARDAVVGYQSSSEGSDRVSEIISEREGIDARRSIILSLIDPFRAAITAQWQALRDIPNQLNHLYTERAQILSALNAASSAFDACARSCPAEVEARENRISLGTYTGFEGQGFKETPDGKGIAKVPWKNISTECVACQGLVADYNRVMRAVYDLRFEIEGLNAIRQSMHNRQDSGVLTLDGLDNQPNSNERGFANNFRNTFLLGSLLLQEETFEDLYTTKTESLKEKELLAREIATQISLCEASCLIDFIPTSMISLGTGGLPSETVPVSVTQIPFDWSGPYTTSCWRCEKLAAELNRLPDLARARLIDIHSIGLEITEMRAERAAAAAQYNEFTGHLADISSGSDQNGNGIPDEVDRMDERIEYAAVRIAEKQAELDKITEHFNTVLNMLSECESSPECRAPLDYRDPVIELEQTFTTLGFNAFNQQDVENINQRLGPVANPPVPAVTPPVVTTPVAITPPVTETVPAPEPEPTPQQELPPPPAGPPLMVTTSGSFGFTHTVGPTSCPQAAGTAQINSNNGNPLSVTNVGVGGAVAGRLNTNVAGNNTPNPSISASFNCSSAQNGSFPGTVTATVTDTVTGESTTITIQVNGTVSG